ncbi:RagB/SusD family nutrient uptake outer membrane protein [Pedobacter caeni]|uniref:RagB/SusD domain-containing protein n=1 Tax=Pedobacter caeni TaxID=288992 RepID=A0A1M5F225_9SPHI|nr:RagB/SusD family nutrient uptake outer membrane protein [Pedobacter caeni]SHF85593.1 RagB/SusD domain-containing protein [Pedobacter caeni]
MKNISTYLFFTGLITLTSCKLNEIPDPNNPSIAVVTENASSGQLQTLVTGLESRSEDYLSATTNALGTFGRDIWYFNNSDSRNIHFWLGQGGRKPDANFYGVEGLYSSPYQAIKQANILITAVQHTSAIPENQKTAYLGFAKTIQGYQYLIPANTQYKNGIRISVSDESNPGPFVSYEEALKAIRALLDEGYQDLNKSGSTLSFKLSSGYNGFNTPQGLAKVNRALAARVAIYQKDWQSALDALNLSFYQLEGELNTGPAHPYGGPPEPFNPLYYVLNGNLSTLPVVHPSFVADALPGDRRVTNKIFVRSNPIISTVGTVPLSSLYQDQRWTSNTTAIPYIRNEELILIYAEASAQLGHFPDAIKAINRIRTAANLPVYTGASNLDALITEILFQRRYSLWFEPAGHRWVDLRRYNRLSEIPVSSDAGTVFTQLERPASEINWEEFHKK